MSDKGLSAEVAKLMSPLPPMGRWSMIGAYWYLIKFAGRSPFSHSALDIKTYAMAAMNTRYRDATKRNMPRRWFPPDNKHSHVALDDAREQGLLFLAMHKEARAQRTQPA